MNHFIAHLKILAKVGVLPLQKDIFSKTLYMAAIRLQNISTKAPKGISKEKTKEKTAKILEELDELQNLLFAESKHAILVVIQGMDASGKDGAIRGVFGKLNPQGVVVKSYKAPNA